MDRDMTIAIITGFCAILGSTFGASIPYLYSAVTVPHATDWINKGNDYYFLDEYGKALSCYSKATELDLRSETAWKKEGLALFALNNYTDAIKALDKAIKLNPQDAKTWFYKGDAHSKIASDLKDAIQAYDKSLELNPRDAEVWSHKGHVLETIGKYNEALEAYNKSFNLNPNDASVSTAIGDVLSIIGNKIDAIETYNLSIDYNGVIIKSVSISPSIGSTSTNFEIQALVFSPQGSKIYLDIFDPAMYQWNRFMGAVSTGSWKQISWNGRYLTSDFAAAKFRFEVINETSEYTSDVFIGPVGYKWSGNEPVN